MISLVWWIHPTSKENLFRQAELMSFIRCHESVAPRGGESLLILRRERERWQYQMRKSRNGDNRMKQYRLCTGVHAVKTPHYKALKSIADPKPPPRIGKWWWNWQGENQWILLIQALTESREILGPAGYLGSQHAKYTQEMNNSKYSMYLRYRHQYYSGFMLSVYHTYGCMFIHIIQRQS